MNVMLLCMLFARLTSALSADNVTAGVHLSLGKSTGSFVVTWQTALIPADTPVFLYYGLHPDALTANVSASSTVLANNDAAAGSKHVMPWRNTSIHKALILGVGYGQTIFYRVSHSADDNKLFNFTNWIPSPAARLSRPFTFAVFGDLAVKDQGGDFDFAYCVVEICKLWGSIFCMQLKKLDTRPLPHHVFISDILVSP